MKGELYDKVKKEGKRLPSDQKLKQVDMEKYVAKNQRTPGDIPVDGCQTRYSNKMKSFNEIN